MAIMRYRREVLISFLILLAFYIAVLFYRASRPFDFIGLETRVLYVMVPVGAVAVLMWFPYRWAGKAISSGARQIAERWAATSKKIMKSAKMRRQREVLLARKKAQQKQVLTKVRIVEAKIPHKAVMKNLPKKVENRPGNKGSLLKFVRIGGLWIVSLLLNALRLLLKGLGWLVRGLIQVIIAFSAGMYSLFSKENRHVAVLLITYALLFVNGLLSIRKLYSIEWAFVGFIGAGILFLVMRIDSRFLILPAIFLIGYCPFLLMGKLNSTAESMAIYAYYLLVVGVVMQFIEQLSKKEARLDFDRVMKDLFRANPFMAPNITLAVLTGVVWWLNSSRPELFGVYSKYTALYLLVAISVLNAIAWVYSREELSTQKS